MNSQRTSETLQEVLKFIIKPKGSLIGKWGGWVGSNKPTNFSLAKLILALVVKEVQMRNTDQPRGGGLYSLYTVTLFELTGGILTCLKSFFHRRKNDDLEHIGTPPWLRSSRARLYTSDLVKHEGR